MSKRLVLRALTPLGGLAGQGPELKLQFYVNLKRQVEGGKWKKGLTQVFFPTFSTEDRIQKYHHRKVKEAKSLSGVRLFETPWTVAYQAPPSMGFSRQEYWSGLPFPSPGDLPNSGNEPGSLTFQANALISEPQGKPKQTKHGLIFHATTWYRRI